jgi:hypothetical protein
MKGYSYFRLLKLPGILGLVKCVHSFCDLLCISYVALSLALEIFRQPFLHDGTRCQLQTGEARIICKLYHFLHY